METIVLYVLILLSSVHTACIVYVFTKKEDKIKELDEYFHMLHRAFDTVRKILNDDNRRLIDEILKEKQAPKFEYDKKDHCWTTKDCIRLDSSDILKYNVPHYHMYINWKTRNKYMKI